MHLWSWHVHKILFALKIPQMKKGYKVIITVLNALFFISFLFLPLFCHTFSLSSTASVTSLGI